MTPCSMRFCRIASPPSSPTQQALRQTKNEQLPASAPNRQPSAIDQYQKVDKNPKVNGIGSSPVNAEPDTRLPHWHATHQSKERPMAAKVAMLVGSLRKGSLTRKVTTALIALAPKSLDCSVHEIGDLPLYNADLDGEPPAAWRRFR